MVSILVNELDVMGGTHKQVLRFCQYLNTIGVDYEILTKRLNYDNTYPEFSNLNVESIGGSVAPSNLLLKFVLDIYLQLKIFKKISGSVDTVNIHDNGFPLVIYLCRLLGKKVYWQVNDLPWVFTVGNLKDAKFSSVRKVYAFFSRVFYKYVIAKSVNKITVNVSKNKIRVAQYLGVDADVYYCGVDQWEGEESKFSMSSGVVRLLTSGVFFPYRNYETQLEVVKALIDRGYDVELNIIGSIDLNPEYALKIKKLIKEMGIENNVFIHGQVDHERYLKLHSSSDIFVFVNVDQSWGLSIFEAMSAGLPVIVSESVGAVEILHDREDSIIVNPCDVNAIVKSVETLMDKNLYKRLSENGASYVNELTWDNMYSKKMSSLMGLV